MKIDSAHIREIIRKRQGLSGLNGQKGLPDSHKAEMVRGTDEKSLNINLITPLILNASALQLGGIRAGLLVTLGYLLSRDPKRPISQKDLARSIRIGLSSLERHISQLRKFGFIEINKILDEHGVSRNTYSFNGLRAKLRALGVDA